MLFCFGNKIGRLLKISWKCCVMESEAADGIQEGWSRLKGIFDDAYSSFTDEGFEKYLEEVAERRVEATEGILKERIRGLPVTMSDLLRMDDYKEVSKYINGETEIAPPFILDKLISMKQGNSYDDDGKVMRTIKLMKESSGREELIKFVVGGIKSEHVGKHERYFANSKVFENHPRDIVGDFNVDIRYSSHVMDSDVWKEGDSSKREHALGLVDNPEREGIQYYISFKINLENKNYNEIIPDIFDEFGCNLKGCVGTQEYDGPIGTIKRRREEIFQKLVKIKKEKNRGDNFDESAGEISEYINIDRVKMQSGGLVGSKYAITASFDAGDNILHVEINDFGPEHYGIIDKLVGAYCSG